MGEIHKQHTHTQKTHIHSHDQHTAQKDKEHYMKLTPLVHNNWVEMIWKHQRLIEWARFYMRLVWFQYWDTETQSIDSRIKIYRIIFIPCNFFSLLFKLFAILQLKILQFKIYSLTKVFCVFLLFFMHTFLFSIHHTFCSHYVSHSSCHK